MELSTSQAYGPKQQLFAPPCYMTLGFPIFP